MATNAIKQLKKRLKYHLLQTDFDHIACYKGKGRPKKGQGPDSWKWKVRGRITANVDAINLAKKTKGKFVLATNELDAKELSNETILAVYKGQNNSVERGFRFLKDPLFFASSLFLKKPGRIMALLMLMGLSLLVFSLGERKLRNWIKQVEEPLSADTGLSGMNPTMRRVFQIFHGIHIVTFKAEPVTLQRIVNLRPVHRKVLEIFAPDTLKR